MAQGKTQAFVILCTHAASGGSVAIWKRVFPSLLSTVICAANECHGENIVLRLEKTLAWFQPSIDIRSISLALVLKLNSLEQILYGLFLCTTDGFLSFHIFFHSKPDFLSY